MAKARLKLVSPSTEVRTVTPLTPLRVPNKELRTREYLTEAEVDRLIEAARKNRWGYRDGTMILIAYRHGLRAAELVDLRWDQDHGRIAVTPPVLPGRRDEPVDLDLGQVLPRPQLLVRHPEWRNCSNFGARRHQLETRFCHMKPPALGDDR